MIRAYVELVRPFTSFPPFLAVLFGSLAGAFNTNSSVEFTPLLYACLSMVFAQIFSQITNQLADPPELDKINEKFRVLVRGDLSKETAELFAFLFLLGSLALAFCVSNFYAFLICLIILCALAYNYEPIRLKKIFILNNLVLAFSRGFLPFLASWCVFSPITQDCLMYAVGLFIWVFGWQTTKDITDVKGDKMFNIKTIPVVLGLKGTYKFLICLTIVFLLYHVALGLAFSFKYVIVCLPPACLSVVGLVKLTERSIEGNSFGWVVFYLGLVSYYFATCSVELVFSRLLPIY